MNKTDEVPCPDVPVGETVPKPVSTDLGLNLGRNRKQVWEMIARGVPPRR